MNITLYRGISNIRQLINILNNRTAGGWRSNSKLTFKELSEKIDVKKLITNQKSPNRECAFQIVCINDTDIYDRVIIEYTHCPSKAESFAALAFIEIEIDEKYAEIEHTNDSEWGRFCISSAPIVIKSIYINSIYKEKCEELKKAIEEYIKKDKLNSWDTQIGCYERKYDYQLVKLCSKCKKKEMMY